MRRGSSELVGVHAFAGRSGSARSFHLARHLRPGDPGDEPIPEHPGAPAAPEQAPTSSLRAVELSSGTPDRRIGRARPRSRRRPDSGEDRAWAAVSGARMRSPPGELRTLFSTYYQIDVQDVAAGSKTRQSTSERGSARSAAPRRVSPRCEKRAATIARAAQTTAASATPAAHEVTESCAHGCRWGPALEIFGHGRLTGTPRATPTGHKVPRGSCGMTLPISTYSWWAPVHRSSAVRPRPARAAITAARTTAFLM